MEMVSIPKTTLQKLIKQSAEFNALCAGGVDNWEWYGESIQDFCNDEGVEDWWDWCDKVDEMTVDELLELI